MQYFLLSFSCYTHSASWSRWICAYHDKALPGNSRQDKAKTASLIYFSWDCHFLWGNYQETNTFFLVLVSTHLLTQDYNLYLKDVSSFLNKDTYWPLFLCSYHSEFQNKSRFLKNLLVISFIFFYIATLEYNCL